MQTKVYEWSSFLNDRSILNAKNERSFYFKEMIEKITKGQKTKQEILKKANQLFSEKGFDATGVDDIVRSLGLSSGVFYNHFESKTALLKQVVEGKIQKSRELLLDVQAKESASEWISRALKTYLSKQHKESTHQSCPLTTLSQELIKLNLHHQTGLSQYTNEFFEILNRRLMMMNPLNAGKANSIMSLCIGAITLARLEKDESKAQAILNDCYQSALMLIERR